LQHHDMMPVMRRFVPLLLTGILLLVWAAPASAYDKFSPQLQAQILNNPTSATVPLPSSTQVLLRSQFSTSVVVGLSSADVVGYGFRLWAVDQQLSDRQVIGISLVQARTGYSPLPPSKAPTAFCTAAENSKVAEKHQLKNFPGQRAAWFFSCEASTTTQGVIFVKGQVIGVVFSEIPAYSSERVIGVATAQYANINTKNLTASTGEASSSGSFTPWLILPILLVLLGAAYLYWRRRRDKRHQTAQVDSYVNISSSVVSEPEISEPEDAQAVVVTHRDDTEEEESPESAENHTGPEEEPLEESASPKKTTPCCHSQRRPGDRFCAGCGQALRCVSCDSELPDNARFCPGCGQRTNVGPLL